MARAVVAIAVVAQLAGPPAAAAEAEARRPVVGYRVRGPSKLTQDALRYLARVRPGDPVGPADLPRIVEALISSELFEKVEVVLEDAPGGDGVYLVAILDDKHSWVIAPTLYLLAGTRAVGLGFAENNLFGDNKKLLLYGQLGDRESMFLGAFLNPSIRGTRLIARVDSYLYRRVNAEYANLDPRSRALARTNTTTYLGGGALLGWLFRWWLTADLRVRGAYLTFRDTHAPDGTPLPAPQTDGWDISGQAHVTVDRRFNDFGVTRGLYAQLTLDTTIPGLDDYGYSEALLRVYHSWRFLEQHQLELRGNFAIGRTLPFHEEVTLGGPTDLRGYPLDQFRGDRRVILRAEYSVPIARWRFFKFRALGFWDGGYIGFHSPRRGGDRDYLPSQLPGTGVIRNNVGAGFRVYVRAIVLPLVGFDVGYGLESRAPELYFQAGITDF